MSDTHPASHRTAVLLLEVLHDDLPDWFAIRHQVGNGATAETVFKLFRLTGMRLLTSVCIIMSCCSVLSSQTQRVPPQRARVAPSKSKPLSAKTPANEPVKFLDMEALTVDSRGTYTEEREICGDIVMTPPLHNVICSDYGDQTCRCIDKWCFKPNNLIVKTPNARWVFVGTPRVNCAISPNNTRSCTWNALGKLDRFSVTLNNPTEIRATAWTSSKTIGINLCAMARYYP